MIDANRAASEDVQELLGVASGTGNAKALLEALMSEWGGPVGLAREVRVEYEELPAGSPSRIKIQTILLDSVMKFGGEGDDDEDDREAAEDLLERMLAARGKLDE